MEDIVFKICVPDSLLSVVVVLLMYFVGCKRAAKKLRRDDRDDQRCGTAG